jgi:hypothetical protein
MEVREAIARQWLDRIAASYPAEGARLIGQERDPFRNPLGHQFQQATGALVDELLDGMDPDRIGAALDAILKIRAVQDFPPGRALAFIFELKSVVRGHATDPPFEELCSRIDQLALAAFDLYMKCREKTYEVRLNEARRQILGRAGSV